MAFQKATPVLQDLIHEGVEFILHAIAQDNDDVSCKHRAKRESSIAIRVDIDKVTIGKVDTFGSWNTRGPATALAKSEMLGRISNLPCSNERGYGCPSSLICLFLSPARDSYTFKEVISQCVCSDAEIVEVVGFVR